MHRDHLIHKIKIHQDTFVIPSKHCVHLQYKEHICAFPELYRNNQSFVSNTLKTAEDCYKSSTSIKKYHLQEEDSKSNRRKQQKSS